MTGYTVHTGSTKKFASNWDNIFSGKTSKTKSPAARDVATTAKPKKAAKKAGGK